MNDADFDALARELGELLRVRGEKLATAESCTGGLIAGAMTAIAGSSDWFERGFVTYSNAAKSEQLKVPAALIEEHGAVSQQVAQAMVEGALAQAPVQWAVAVTGIAGPGGAVPGKPVGTVWLAWGRAGQVHSHRLMLAGDRAAVRRQTVDHALKALCAAVRDAPATQRAPATEPRSDEPWHVLLEGDFEPGEFEAWRSVLSQAAPEVVWQSADEARQQPQRVRAAVVAQPQPGSLQGWPGLRLIQSLWAGVDRLLADPQLPVDVPLARMVDPLMSAAMAETALWSVLALHRGFFVYARQQQAGEWRQQVQRRAQEHAVLVLGQGAMGQAVMDALRGQGYPVTGWRRSAGRAVLDGALPHAQVLINLLPLTPETRGILNADLLARLPPGAAVVNLARGAHLVERDLLDALATGQIAHAVLDVFHTEPLPPDHAFWRHPAVTVLPHVAASTDLRSAAQVVADNLRRLRTGEPLMHVVDRQLGY